MQSLTEAQHPLDFAYQAVKRMPIELGHQFSFLNRLALLYGKPSKPVSSEKALLLLSEIRQSLLQRGMDSPQSFSDYADLAETYEQLGQPEISQELLDDLLILANQQRGGLKYAGLTAVARAYHDRGEDSRSRELIRKLELETRQRKFFTDSFRDSWAWELFMLYLEIDMVVAAEQLAAKMSSFCRSAALAELAFHGQDLESCNASLLKESLRLALASNNQDAVSKLAVLHATHGQFEQAEALLHKLVRPEQRHTTLLQITNRLMKAGNLQRATELIQKVWQDCQGKPLWFTEDELLKQLIPLSLFGQDEFADTLLQQIHAKAEALAEDNERLQHSASLINQLVVFGHRQKAEQTIDNILASRLDALDPHEDQPGAYFCRTTPLVIYSLATAIDRHQLSWNRMRKDSIRAALAPYPVYS